MVAETRNSNWIKDAMVCSSKCRFGRFFGKILVASKINYFPRQLSLIFGICIPVPGLCILYISGDSCQVSKMLKKKKNLWIIALNLPTCM